MESTAAITDLFAKFYFDWGQIQTDLKKMIDGGKHVILHGPPRQGKSSIIKHTLADCKRITLYASEDFGFVDISRNILLTLGCSVTTERKKKLKASAKAEVKFAWPFVASADAGGETEQTLRTFTAEIGNPNDVCHLLGQFNEVPVIVVEGFDLMARRDRRLLLEFLKVTSENKTVTMILVASTLENPLEYRERLECARYLDVINLPLMTADKTRQLIEAACKHLKVPNDDRLSEMAFSRFKGGLEGTLEVCGHYAAQRQLSGPSSTDPMPAVTDGFATKLSAEFQRRSRERFFALLWSFIEAEWTIGCYRLVATSSDENAIDDDEDDRENDAHETNSIYFSSEDSVYRTLDSEIRSQITFEQFIELYLLKNNKTASENEKVIYRTIFENIKNFAKETLCLNRHDDNVRFLAFAAAAFLQGRRYSDYLEAHEDEVLSVNIGMIIAHMLSVAPSSQDVIFDRNSLEKYLSEKSLVLKPKRARGRKDGHNTQIESIVSKTSNRILRRQRQLRLDPPVFEVIENRGVVIWSAVDAYRYGDIKEEFFNIIKEAEYLYGIDAGEEI